MASQILAFALVAKICLVSAASLSPRIAGPKSFDNEEKAILWVFVGMAAFGAVWVGGFKTYDWVKANYTTSIEAKRQANDNADLEAGISIELDNIKFPEPVKMKRSTSVVSNLMKKLKKQDLYVAGQRDTNNNPNAGRSGMINQFSSMSTLREQDDPPPEYVKGPEFAVGSPGELDLSDSEDEKSEPEGSETKKDEDS